MIYIHRSVVAVLIAFAATAGLAQEHASRPAGERGHTEQGRSEQNAPGVLSLLPSDAVTEQASTPPAASSPIRRLPARCRCSINRRTLRRGLLHRLCGESERRRARPLTFVFNGGPGAASAYLNLGLAGRASSTSARAATTAPPPGSSTIRRRWLAFTDLVLIDPVGTGWSRAAKPDGASAFWGVRSDAEVDGQGDRALCRQEQPRRARRNIFWARATAASAPPRSRARCRAIRASSSLASSWCRRCLKASFQLAVTQFALGAALQFPALVATELEGTGKFSKEALAQAERFAMTEYLTTLTGPPLAGDAAKIFYAPCCADDRIAGGCRRPLARLHP